MSTICFLIDRELVELPPFVTPGAPRPILEQAVGPGVRALAADDATDASDVPFEIVTWECLCVAQTGTEGVWAGIYTPR